jgi:hypothetical protein
MLFRGMGTHCGVRPTLSNRIPVVAALGQVTIVTAFEAAQPYSRIGYNEHKQPRLVLQNILSEIAKTPAVTLLTLSEAARQDRKSQAV